MIEALPPRIDALSPIGAGDAMAAAYVWAMTKKKEFPDAVRWAVAAATALATQLSSFIVLLPLMRLIA